MEKNIILNSIQSLVASRIEEAKKEIASINNSKTNETKSSAGDKYETGMAMLQIEEQKANIQLAKANDLKKALSLIDPSETHEEVQLGSWVETSNGNYFLSIGLGKLIIEEKEVFVLSITSPLGLHLKGKKSGDIVDFRANKISIKAVR